MLNVEIVVECEIFDTLPFPNFGLVGARTRRKMFKCLAKLIVIRRDIKYDLLFAARNANRDQVNNQIV